MEEKFSPPPRRGSAKNEKIMLKKIQKNCLLFLGYVLQYPQIGEK